MVGFGRCRHWHAIPTMGREKGRKGAFSGRRTVQAAASRHGRPVFKFFRIAYLSEISQTLCGDLGVGDAEGTPRTPRSGPAERPPRLPVLTSAFHIEVDVRAEIAACLLLTLSRPSGDVVYRHEIYGKEVISL